MTKIERILAATRFKRVDRVPKGEFYLEDGFVAKLLGLNKKVEFKDRVEACEICGLDALAFSPSQHGKALVWDGLTQWRKKTDFFIFALIDGPFQATAKLFPSFTDFLMAIAKCDPIIPGLATKAVAHNIELGLNALASGANGIIIADDIAYQRGTFISPDTLRKFFFPHLTEQVNILRTQELPVFFHADGNVISVLSDIISSGFDGMHSLDFSSLADIAKVKKAIGNSLCLMGGYNLGWLDEDNRKKRALELLEVASSGGGYIFGSSAGIIGSDLSAKQVTDVYQFVSEFQMQAGS